MNDPDTSISVLAVSPHQGDIQLLSRILEHSAWKFQSAAGVAQAREVLLQRRAQVVLTDHSFPDGTWKDVLQAVSALPDPPCVLVLARNNDERTWAEALKYGAWDILPRPFIAIEVFRTVYRAWQHWQDSSRTRQRNLGISRRPAASEKREISISAAG